MKKIEKLMLKYGTVCLQNTGTRIEIYITLDNMIESSSCHLLSSGITLKQAIKNSYKELKVEDIANIDTVD